MAEEIETGIAESGYPVPVAIIDALQPVQWIKPEGQDGAEESFDHRRILGDPQAHPYHPIQFILVQGRLDVQPGLEVDPFPHDHGEKGGKQHQTQASQLDERDDHQLAEQRKIRPGIHHHQARDTGSGGGGEQGVHKGQGRAVRTGKRQHQQQSSGQDQPYEGQGDQLGRRKAFDLVQDGPPYFRIISGVISFREAAPHISMVSASSAPNLAARSPAPSLPPP